MFSMSFAPPPRYPPSPGPAGADSAHARRGTNATDISNTTNINPNVVPRLPFGKVPFAFTKEGIKQREKESIKEKRKTVEVDRKIGYGSVEAWVALSPTDQARIRGHSQKLLYAFRNTKWFLRSLGNFPFSAKKLEDGSYNFTMSCCSLSYLLFLLISIVIMGIFIMFTVGTFMIFVDGYPNCDLIDRCGNTWGQNVLSRNLPAIMFVWCQLLITTAGNFYVIFHGRGFLSFYNCVNEAVMQLDVDPTHGMLSSDMRGLIVFGSLFVVCVCLFASGKFYSLEEVSAFVVQALCYFFKRDLYNVGAKLFTANHSNALTAKCDTLCKNCYGSNPNVKYCARNNCYNAINRPTIYFTLMKWGGFLIIAYSMLGARALIRQFEFFCQVLVNLTSVWNKRFLIYASNDNTIKMEDPFRRRISNDLILKDHYEIVRLYNETEEHFSFILFMYYLAAFFNMICQFYYTALLSTQVTCNEAVKRELAVLNSPKCNNTAEITSGLEGMRSRCGKPIVSFEDPCTSKDFTIIRQALISTIVLLIVTLSSFIITTLEADRASHQADVGFYRVRKRGYMTCKTKKERNAMHSLVFSFTGPKPFCITAAGFFPIRKKTIVIVTSVAFIYFLIILGFKPGMLKAQHRCINKDDGEYLVKYPKVV